MHQHVEDPRGKVREVWLRAATVAEPGSHRDIRACARAVSLNEGARALNVAGDPLRGPLPPRWNESIGAPLPSNHSRCPDRCLAWAVRPTERILPRNRNVADISEIFD